MMKFLRPLNVNYIKLTQTKRVIHSLPLLTWVVIALILHRCSLDVCMARQGFCFACKNV